jgi:hypothetical protein
METFTVYFTDGELVNVECPTFDQAFSYGSLMVDQGYRIEIETPIGSLFSYDLEKGTWLMKIYDNKFHLKPVMKG